MKKISLYLLFITSLFYSCSRTIPINEKPLVFIQKEAKNLYDLKLKSIQEFYDKKRKESVFQVRLKYFKALESQKETIPKDQLLINSYNFIGNFVSEMNKITDSLNLTFIDQERKIVQDYQARYTLFIRSCDNLRYQLNSKSKADLNYKLLEQELDSLRLDFNPLP